MARIPVTLAQELFQAKPGLDWVNEELSHNGG
jgi:hypothetical protein